MTGEEAIKYIDSFAWYGSRPGLERTEELLRIMGNPQRELKFIHIAGTNGKGSTAAMLESILREAGYRTGLNTSPYLYRFNERIKVNGADIDDDELGDVTAFVRACAEEMSEPPTEFELITCISFEYFMRKLCDCVVLEVGMGGRLDATNVITSPAVSVIANIGLDHMQQLGDTVEKIAQEKAGIIKPGRPAVIYQQQPSVETVIRDACIARGCELTSADFSLLHSESDSLDGQKFGYRDRSGLELHLLGEHQLRNAAVVLDTVDELNRQGFAISEQAVRAGLEKARWPGRFELVCRSPRFIVDGGHNPQCAAAVAQGLRRYFPNEKLVFLIGVLADKDYPGILSELAPLASEFVCVTPDSPRALEAHKLGDYLDCYGLPVTVCGDIREGVKTAREHAGTNGAACSVGSLYMTGAVRDAFGLYSKS